MTRFLKPRAVYLAGLGLLAIATVDLMRRFRQPDPLVIGRSIPSEWTPMPAPRPPVKAQTAAPAPAPATPKTTKGDDLTQIKGIGPTYAKRLQDAGLMTYTDIVNTSAEQLRDITRATGSDPADWITEARSLNGH